MSKKNAPWELEVVGALWARQKDPNKHPYTCVTHGTAVLIPTYNGWVCPDDECDYTQDWCHFLDAYPEK